ncbi:hypothetical protein LTR84_006920 [Exophiala bonariae]|uniref:Uncharacterized protein n=1 Tax=Exophiala bonariae TaxID=1690606 RepID=A0AAV9MZ93_9EURO|nr:hypothetical protein LTR84_006920 [Exophiala bonariae]
MRTTDEYRSNSDGVSSNSQRTDGSRNNIESRSSRPLQATTRQEEHLQHQALPLIEQDSSPLPNATTVLPILRPSSTRRSQHRSEYEAIPLSENEEPLTGNVSHSTLTVQNTPAPQHATQSQYAALSMVDTDDEPSTTSDVAPAVEPSSPPKDPRPPTWKPFALKRPTLLASLIFSLVLGGVVIFLLVYSTLHSGLGTDGGSSAVFFGWRFTPTLVAVLYTLLPAMIFTDARRTEPFAQMAHPSGAPAATSILKRPSQWWTVLTDSFRRRQNHGTVNWFLLATVLVNMISSLLISPLSSALLQSEPVDLVSQVPISQYVVSESQPISMAATDLTYFRTISNILQNLDTSAWLTDKYFIVPWWPSDIQSNLGTTLMGITQQWKADAQVLSMDLKCEAMEVHAAYWEKDFYDPNYEEVLSKSFHSLLLTDSKGCEAGINGYDQRIVSRGGGSWFLPPDFVIPMWEIGDEDAEYYHYYNSTPQCDGRQVILATSGSWVGDTDNTTNSDLKVGAWSCESEFYAANMAVNASTTTTGTTISVDEAIFDANRKIVPATVIDRKRFESAFLHKNWTSMLYTADPNGRAPYGGPSALLAALYDFDSSSLIASNDSVKDFQRIKQRFFGEMALATIAGNAVDDSQTIQLTDTQNRVVVNLPVAITLAVLFIITSAMIGVLLLLSNRRPLNLHDDPNAVAAVVKLIDGNQVINGRFHDWDENKRKGRDLADSLLDTTHFLQDGKLESVKSIAPIADYTLPQKKPREDWRPFTVGRLGGFLLLLLFSSIFTTILVLFVLSHTTGLYQSAFTYEKEYKSSQFLTFAPYSIVPTLLAVIVVLWWDNIDETFRRLQPYVTMAKEAVPITSVIGLTYLSTLSINSMFQALGNKHWLVALVSFGAVLGQVLTVSMSALWQRAEGSRLGDMVLTRTLEPRTLPFVQTYAVGGGMGGGSGVGQLVLSDFYAHLSTNWLYSATLQLAYNGSEAPWSKDGWSFAPIDLSSIPESAMYKSTPSTKNSTSGVAADGPGVNVTLTTPAIRGTLDCTVAEAATNLSAWLTEWDMTDRDRWNVSTNPTGLERGFEVNSEIELGPQAGFSTTPILAVKHTIVCCANRSGDVERDESAIGYWSANYGEYRSYDFEDDSGPYPRNLTIKWIRGNAARELYNGNETYESDYNSESGDLRHLIWSKAPTMSAMNCRPRIEQVNATVTVDMKTKQIWTYQTLGTPEVVDWPWSDVYLPHNYSEPGDGYDAGGFHEQITISFGVLFQDAMMFASDLGQIWPSPNYDTKVERLIDKTFNLRRPDLGLNADLMSYSMYQLAGGDLDKLTNSTQMMELGQKVFSTFFQHFASMNNSASGGWAFQKIGTTLPPNLGPVLNASTSSGLAEYQTQNTSLTSETTATVHVDISVEILQMAPVAVYLTLSILLILAIITVVITLMAYPHFKLLNHNFDDLCSVIAVVYASEKLQRWVRANPEPGQWSEKQVHGQTPYVRLGRYVGSGGVETWGIDLVEDDLGPPTSVSVTHKMK